ncbi:hypothetical protein TNCV_3072801 [Trichonephila clavipes]|nr:hypothetical protein TNCV_3072801 [Trichonephila clavipes]
MVKVTESRLACHEFQPRTAEDPPCRGGRCVLNMSRLKRPPVGGLWKLSERMSAQVSSLSLDHSSKLRDPSPKSPRVAEYCDVNIYSLIHLSHCSGKRHSISDRDYLIGTSAHALQRPMVMFPERGTVGLGPHGLLRH